MEEEDEARHIYSELDQETGNSGGWSSIQTAVVRLRRRTRPGEALSPPPHPDDLRDADRPRERWRPTPSPGGSSQQIWGQAQERPDGFMGMFA